MCDARRSSGVFRYLSGAGVATGTSQALTPRRRSTLSSSAYFTSTQGAICPVDRNGRAWRGAAINFFGTPTANNATVNYWLWGVPFLSGKPGATPTISAAPFLIGNGALTFSNAVTAGQSGTDDLILGAAEFYADTITFTIGSATSTIPSPYSKMVELFGLGSEPDVFSPANDYPAALIVPNVFAAALAIEFASFSNLTAANAAIELFA